MDKLIREIQNCTLCIKSLPLGPKPIIAAGRKSKIIIIGQAPGKVVHHTGIPWNDKSGDTLRKWLGVDEKTFYNTSCFALIPMGFCYPGKNKTGDLPPRPECAPQWHSKLLSYMKDVKLILLIGNYSQQYYLKEKALTTLTETVKQYKNYLPRYFPLPHPSPRNNIWQAKNKWFVSTVLPDLQKRVAKILSL